MALCLLTAAAVLAAGAELRPIGPGDLFALKSIGEIEVSPGGETVLFTVSTASPEANRTTSRLMKITLPGDKVSEMAAVPSGAHNLRWSQDGQQVAFVASKEGETSVWVYTPPTGALTRVCRYDRGNSFLSKAGNSLAWSPDGSRIAFSGTLEPPPVRQDPIVITRLLYKTRTELSDNRRSHIYVVPASGGQPQAVTSGEYDEHSIDWGGRGDEVIFLSNREPDPDARLNYDIFAVNVQSGAIRRITSTPGVEMEPRVSPDGRLIAYTATKRPLTTIDSVAEDAHIWVIPAAGGQGRELNAALDRRSSSPEWAADGKSILYTAADHGRIAIYRVPKDGGGSEALVSGRAQAGPFSMDRRSGSIVFGLTDPGMPRELFVLARGAAQPRRLTNLNAETIQGWKLVEPEDISYKSFDGTEIQAWLYPRESGAGASPMILSIHGGPHGMFGYSFDLRSQIYSARGYATLLINPRGSSSYGQRFSDGCVNDWGGGDYKDLMAGVDSVLKTHPGIDRERLGVTGTSYGGYMTNWVITQTGRFKAATAVASLSDLISFYATSLYQDLVHAEFGGYPWDDSNFERLWDRSPLAHVKKVTTPTLFLHGERDNDVHITQAEEMYTALRERGVESVFVRYPREGHGFHEPKHQLDALERTLEWMDRFVKPSR